MSMFVPIMLNWIVHIMSEYTKKMPLYVIGEIKIYQLLAFADQKNWE